MNVLSFSTSVTLRQRLLQSYMLVAFVALLLAGMMAAILIPILPTTPDTQSYGLDSWLWLLALLLLLTIFGVAVAGLMGWYISGKLTEPLEALAQAANKMAVGDYDARVSSSDMEEFQTLAASFNTMAKEVQEARESQQKFLANVNHDLRTPLMSIQGFSQAFIDGVVPAEQMSRIAKIIYSEATRLSRLIQDLLDLTQIEAGRFSMAVRDINLKDVLEQSSEKFKVQADRVGVDFEYKLPRHPLRVHGDATRLEQVLSNLVDNALTYAQDGGRHVKLISKLGGIRGNKQASNGHLAHQKETNQKLGRWWVEIKVEDNGPPIPEEQKALIFKRFHRTDQSPRGAGLGLAIAREIVEAHGGDLDVKNGAVEGTQFVVRLPMKMN